MSIESEAVFILRRRLGGLKEGSLSHASLQRGFAGNQLRALEFVCAGCPNLQVKIKHGSRSANSVIMACSAGLKPETVTIDTPLGTIPPCKPL